MTTCICQDLLLISPELFLGFLALSLQLIGVIKKISKKTFCRIAVFGLVVTIYMLLSMPSVSSSAFGESYAVNYYTTLCKLLVMITTFCVVVFYIGHSKSTETALQSEYIVLILLSSLGSCIAISARDLIVLFVGLELMSLPSYVLAAFDRNSSKSSEAGLKYFVLGALSSCIMLFGMSMLYGFADSTSYTVISKVLARSSNIGLIIGAVLLLSSILFKLSIAPFHVWTPDVYEGSPITSVSFFGGAMKIGAITVLINILFIMLPSMEPSLVLMLKILSILSMVIGSVGAVMQTSLKRLMAYSAILNMGYALVPLMIFDDRSLSISLTYVFIYAISTIGLFTAISVSLGSASDTGTISDLAGIARTKKATALIISICMFSMIGIPPFAGFFGKYYILVHALRCGEYLLAISMILTSVIAAYYYLNIVKSMYFCDSTIKASRDKLSGESLLLLVLTASFILLFSIFAKYSPLIINFS